MNQPNTVTVSTTRTAKPGCEADFERALHDFVQRSLSLQGQLGVHIMRPAPGSSSREYGIIRKFANRDALAEFRTSPEYLEWNQLALELTEGGARVEELCGLESWFTLPGEALRPLPKWKMALVTFLGVYPLTSILPRFFTGLLPGWHALLVNVIATGVIVAALTWLIMPLLTRLFAGWLFAKHK
jgi:antibiotic biosynthesis monooxygenase (ABM) superfamily enzyme